MHSVFLFSMHVLKKFTSYYVAFRWLPGSFCSFSCSFVVLSGNFVYFHAAALDASTHFPRAVYYFLTSFLCFHVAFFVFYI